MMTSIIIFAVCYLLIMTEKFNKTVLAICGACVAILLQQIPCQEALAKVDLNVVFLLAGMMMIVNILSISGVFEWSAVTLARKARGNGLLIIVFFTVLTAVVSAVLDNVTTVILLAPVTILISQILELPTVPFLIMEAIFSNIGGTATLVGDPPNILIGSETTLTFTDFLVNLGPAIAIIMVASLGLLVFYLRGKTATREAARELIMRAEPRKALIEPFVLKRSLGVFALVLAGFFLGHFVNIEPGIVALTGAFVMAAVCRVDIHKVLGKVEWETIMFFVGLFMLIGALEVNGVFQYLGHAVLSVTRHHLAMTVLGVMWIAAIGSAVVDNIPLVIAMIPLIKTIIPEFAVDMGLQNMPAAIHTQIEAPLFWALALGACLGGNGTLIGASANVVVSQIAKRNGYDISFLGFTRYGIVFMLMSLVLSSVYMMLRYFVFA
jgi:Na+/H+ antiporter NhaD/arsenite permease-like protein